MSADLQYAHCTSHGCGATFADRAEATKHSSDTLDAAKAENPNWNGSISGHGFQIDNPTDDERRVNKVRNAVSWGIESAVQEFVDAIDRKVERGDFTADEVREQLRGFPDFADAWDEYMVEMAE